MVLWQHTNQHIYLMFFILVAQESCHAEQLEDPVPDDLFFNQSLCSVNSTVLPLDPHNLELLNISTILILAGCGSFLLLLLLIFLG